MSISSWNKPEAPKLSLNLNCNGQLDIAEIAFMNNYILCSKTKALHKNKYWNQIAPFPNRRFNLINLINYNVIINSINFHYIYIY